MKVWITKYALTQGILCAEAETCGPPTMIRVDVAGEAQYYHSPHWYTTEWDALDRAIEMATKKILALEKQSKSLQQQKATWQARGKGSH